MIIINNINVPLDTDFDNLNEVAAKELKINKNEIISVSLYKKSVDARKKRDVHFCISLLVCLKNEEKALKTNKNCRKFEKEEYEWKKATKFPEEPPVVVGFGPAGMFAALSLARAGLCPVIIERGKAVEEREKDVESFFSGGKLDKNSNVQFGEGGAGTFSDGKLNTGIKNNRCRTVLEEFVRHGADEKILYEAKPHIGTDVLKTVVKNIRNEIISLGGTVKFSSVFENFKAENGILKEITVNGENVACSSLILCCGHSARDTFKMLKENKIKMEPKPFSVGVRIEHLQSDINKALYGEFATHPALGAADYKLAVHLKSGRGVYTFCMCPGGSVINASSVENAFAVNGMSNSARNGKNANSALLVGVNPEDFQNGDVLAGCEMQEKIEKAAYNTGKGKLPVDTVGHFVNGKKAELKNIKPTVLPEVAFCDFGDIFPSFVCESLKEGIKEFGKKIEGFDDDYAVLTAPETRSSSPVRILRDETLNSSVKGIYPCGEGAGYAGGIMSSAVDGLKIAEKIIEKC